MVEMTVLIAGFALSGAVVSRSRDWRHAPQETMIFGLAAYSAIGLALSGPIMVSWRERLGRRRPVWGLGESLWFAIGIFVQDAVATYLVSDRLGPGLGFGIFCALVLLLPPIYLTGNPRIELGRAPASWSNIVGLLNMVLWGVTLWSLSVLP